MVSTHSEIWSWFIIPDPDPRSGFWFFTYPVSRGQKATGSRIPDLDLHHCFPVLENNFSLPGSVSRYAEPLNLDLFRIWIRNTDPSYAYLLNPGSLPDAGSLITFILAKSARYPVYMSSVPSMTDFNLSKNNSRPLKTCIFSCFLSVNLIFFKHYQSFQVGAFPGRSRLIMVTVTVLEITDQHDAETLSRRTILFDRHLFHSTPMTGDSIECCKV